MPTARRADGLSASRELRGPQLSASCPPSHVPSCCPSAPRSWWRSAPCRSCARLSHRSPGPWPLRLGAPLSGSESPRPGCGSWRGSPCVALFVQSDARPPRLGSPSGGPPVPCASPSGTRGDRSSMQHQLRVDRLVTCWCTRDVGPERTRQAAGRTAVAERGLPVVAFRLRFGGRFGLRGYLKAECARGGGTALMLRDGLLCFGRESVHLDDRARHGR